MFIQKCEIFSRVKEGDKLKKNKSQTGFKGPYYVRGQGAIRFKNGAYTSVREYFEADRNTAIGHKMGL